MRLLLTVLSTQRSTLGDRSTHAFDVAGGAIGRSAGCEWSLPDPGNTLSSRHAAIAHNGHGFVVTDTSTNGVYLNTVDTPLGRNQSASLDNGDTLYLGDYIISVALLKEPASQAAVPTAFPSPSHFAPPQAFGQPQAFAPPQAFPQHGAFPQAAPPPAAHPMAAPPAAMPAPGPAADRFGLSLNDLMAPAPMPPQPGYAPPPVAFAPAPSAPPAPMPGGGIPDDFDFSDLMAPGMSAPPPPAPLRAAAPQTIMPPFPAAAPPQPMPAQPMPPQPMPAPVPMQAMPQPVPMPQPLPPVAMPDFSNGAMPAPAAAPLDPLAMLRQRAIARAASIDLSRPMSDASQAAPTPAPRPRQAIGDAMPGGMASSGTASGGASDADAFWQALGLNPQAIPAASRQDILAELGSALRETAAGLVAILSARKSMKDEFRIDQTRLAAQENNPFKFFRSGDDALRRVIVEGKPGYLPLDRAVKQGFADIQAHEIATVVAMQNALRKLLTRTAPAAIEAGVEPGLLGRRPDKSRLWERYVETHSGLSGDLDRTTREMLAEEFARAYADQMQAAPMETGR